MYFCTVQIPVLSGTGDFAAQNFKLKCLGTNQAKILFFFQRRGAVTLCVFSYVSELQNSMSVGYIQFPRGCGEAFTLY